MQRYKLLIEFDGTDYAGWQRQKNAPSIQEALESAVKAFCGEQQDVCGAGRTDAGVHGIAMAAHVDIAKQTTAFRVQQAINFHLGKQPISVVGTEAIEPDFHARFSCMRRSYRYRIINRRPPLTLDRGKAWRIVPDLDAEAMAGATQILVGKHDFTTFRATMCQAASPIKTIDKISVQCNQQEITVDCTAPSFLHNQVRSIVGALVAVGQKKWSQTDLQAALDAKDRTKAAQVAPACGLYFLSADYGP